MTDVAGPGGVHHVAIAVRDLEVQEAFYRGVLGLPVLRRWPMAGDDTGDGRDRSVWLDLGSGAFLALERGADPQVASEAATSPDRTQGYLMIALRIRRAARSDWEARLAAAGVAVVDRTAYTLYLADPEGNRVGLSHWPDPAQDPTSPISPPARTTG
ncbi:MAG TPA: VOC family protein [Polyangia bacterium]|jgi:glyoxylase I family protein|nr:VOC family protein [Polyangia bacterium]